jgi:hypothetical protein
MWHLIHSIAVLLGLLLGVFCILTAIILYPDEEGKIQSKFEDFWISVDDYKNLALSRHATFMTQVAKLESGFLDLVFGKKVLSKRAIAFSFAFSIASLAATSVLGVFLSSSLITAELDSFLGNLFGGSLLLGILLFVGLGFFHGLSFLWKREVFNLGVALIGLAAIALSIFYLGMDSEYNGRLIVPPSLLEFTFVALGGLICDIAFIAITRTLIRWAGEMTNSLRVLGVVFVNLLVGLVLICPLPLFHSYTGSEMGAPKFLFSVGVTNLLDSALTFLFVFLALILLIHRAIWPLLTRTLFRMADMGTKARRGILMTVGLAVLGWAGVQLPGLAKDLLKALGKA